MQEAPSKENKADQINTISSLVGKWDVVAFRCYSGWDRFDMKVKHVILCICGFLSSKSLGNRMWICTTNKKKIFFFHHYGQALIKIWNSYAYRIYIKDFFFLFVSLSCPTSSNTSTSFFLTFLSYTNKNGWRRTSWFRNFRIWSIGHLSDAMFCPQKGIKNYFFFFFELLAWSFFIENYFLIYLIDSGLLVFRMAMLFLRVGLARSLKCLRARLVNTDTRYVLVT